jgi:hypothetical protein
VIGILSLAAVGCGASNEQLRSRAAFDLMCPSDRLAVVDIDHRAKGVSGCGSFATYVRTCRPLTSDSPSRHECSWAMNHSDERMDVGYMR